MQHCLYGRSYLITTQFYLLMVRPETEHWEYQERIFWGEYTPLELLLDGTMDFQSIRILHQTLHKEKRQW